MGLAFYRMKRREEALKVFSQATKIDPTDATARYNEACMLAMLGKVEQALGSLEEALNLDPKLGENAKTDADFALLRNNPQFIQLLTTPAMQENEELEEGPLDILSH